MSLPDDAVTDTPEDSSLDLDESYRLSPFVCIRPVDGSLQLESISGDRRLSVSPSLFALLSTLADGARIDALLDQVGPENRDRIQKLLRHFLIWNWIEPCSDQNPEEAPDHWHYYNLHAHVRSRRGRFPLGPFSWEPNSSASAESAVRPVGGDSIVSLPVPDAEGPCQTISLPESLNRRTSIRSFSGEPLSMSDLGAFLYHCCRVEEQFMLSDGPQVTSRTYPSGGSLYPLEVYLIPHHCDALDRDLYRYHPVEHALVRTDAPAAALQRLLEDAAMAANASALPPALFCIACRFRRMQTKYSRLAYSLILKEVGCLYQSMWLVGHALGLAPCGLGTGNMDVFAEAAGTDVYEESTVGEFILGPRPATDSACD